MRTQVQVVPTSRTSFAAVLVGLSLGCGSSESTTVAPAAADAIPVRTLVVHPTALAAGLVLVGAVDADDSVELRSEASGAVVEVGCKDGAKVHKGDLILRVRDEDARAGLAEAKARFSLASNDYQRAKSLFDRSNISQAELDQAGAERDLAQSAVARADEALRRTRLLAPFDGTLGLCSVAPGQVIDPSLKIARLEALDRLVVDVQLPEHSVSAVHAGMKATVTVAAAGSTTSGVVSAVSPRLDPSDRSATARIALEPGSAGLLPGMTASVRVETDQSEDAIQIPTQALMQGVAGPSVYVVPADGKAIPRPVEIGARQEESVVVTKGLVDGDRVVVDGLAKLRPGALVKEADAP